MRVLRAPTNLMFIAATAAGLAGCAGIGDNFREPDVRLDRVILRGAGVRGGTMDLVLDVYNPNDFNLRGTKLQLGLDVEGSHVGDITYDEEFAVPQDDTTRITLPLTFDWSCVCGAVRAALDYGDLPYEMKGQATLRTPWGQRVVEFTKQGRAPLTRSGGGIPIPGISSE